MIRRSQNRTGTRFLMLVMVPLSGGLFGAAHAQNPPATRQVICHGDSLTWGANASSGLGTPDMPSSGRTRRRLSQVRNEIAMKYLGFRPRMRPVQLKRPLGMAVAVAAMATTVLLGAVLPAAAFTNADADAAVNAYLKAFAVPNAGGDFIKGDQNGGDPGFWQEIEQIEGIEDANDRAGGAYYKQVAALLNGFSRAHGNRWSDNIYNDDISWAVIAYTRGYQATGNVAFRAIAKDNFDMMFARAWNPAKGALYWTTNNTSYNSCIECPAGIAACLLSRTLSDSAYMSKAGKLLAWEKANLFDAKSGAIWDAIDIHGKIGTWSSTYNQGTFVGLADFLGDTAAAKLAADYTRDHLGKRGASDYQIMPEYGAGGDNNSGLNSIGLRWISRFMKTHNLQSDYLGWLQANANTAWSIRRTSDNLSWCQWLKPTPDGVLHSWDCINSVVALQVTPADGTGLKSQSVK